MIKMNFIKISTLFIVLAVIFSTAFCACSDDELSVAEITLSHSTLSVEALTKTALTASVKISGNISTETEIVWGSNNQEVATVDENGVVSTHIPGKATITAMAEGQNASCLVTVTRSTVVAEVTVTPANAEIMVGKNISLIASIAPEGAVGTAVWSSSDPAIATVDAVSGEVLGISAGTTDIIATAGAKSGACRIVVSKIPTVSGVTVTPSAATVFVGGNFALTASLLPAGIEATVSWSSSDTAIATVDEDSGIVTGIKEGNATITATSGEFSATSAITIKQDIDGYAPTRAFYPGATVGLPTKMTTYKGAAKFSYVSEDESIAKIIDEASAPKILFCGDGSAVSSNQIYDKKTIVNVIVKNELDVTIAAVKINVRSSFCGFFLAGYSADVFDFGQSIDVAGTAAVSGIGNLRAIYYKVYDQDTRVSNNFINFNEIEKGSIINWTPGVVRLPSVSGSNLNPDLTKATESTLYFASNNPGASGAAYYRPDVYIHNAPGTLEIECRVGNEISGTVTRKFTVSKLAFVAP